MHARETARREPLLDLFGRGIGRQFHRHGHDQARVAARGRPRQQLSTNRLRRIVPHCQRRLLVEELRRARVEQLQMIVQLGHCADGRARAAHRVGLVDGDGRRHAIDPVHGGSVHAVEKLPRIGAEGFDIAPLAFGIQGVEDQTRFARAARPRHDRHLAGADIEVEILQVMLPRAADADQAAHGTHWEVGGRTF